MGDNQTNSHLTEKKPKDIIFTRGYATEPWFVLEEQVQNIHYQRPIHDVKDVLGVWGLAGNMVPEFFQDHHLAIRLCFLIR